jgi:hypothetical protein
MGSISWPHVTPGRLDVSNLRELPSVSANFLLIVVALSSKGAFLECQAVVIVFTGAVKAFDEAFTLQAPQC